MDFEKKIHCKKTEEFGGEEPDKEPSDLVVNVFRHGQARYEQKKTKIGDAEDLTPEGKAEVRKQAEKLAQSISPEEEITIWASPFGRTLETAKIITDVLKERELNLRKIKKSEDDSPENFIRHFEVFEEVRGFDQGLFSVFVNGGVIEHGREKKQFTKEQLNPKNLSWVDYFNERAWEQLEDGIKQEIPEEKLVIMNRIEREVDSNERLKRKLQTLSRITNKEKKRRIIIVTHQGVMSELSDDAVDTSDFIELRFGEKKNNPT